MHFGCTTSSLFQQPVFEHDIDDGGNRLDAVPIALEFARQRDPANRLCTSLNDAFEAGAVCFDRRPGNGVDYGIYFVTLAQGIECSERHAHFGPERAENEFSPSGCTNCSDEIEALPRVDGRAIDRRKLLQFCGEFRDGWPDLTRCDVHRRMDDREVERVGGLGGRYDVLE